MKRRQFLQVAGAGVAALSIPGRGWAKASAAAVPPLESGGSSTGAWRTVEITTSVRRTAEGPSQLWLPVPLEKTSYQEHLGTTWSGNYSRGGLLKDETYSTPVYYVEWEKAGNLELDVTYRVRLRDRSGVEKADPAEARLFLKSSEHIPVDGKVKELAAKIVGHQRDADRKARAIYEWVVENTVRDKAVRGCGVGDVRAMIDSGKYSGKCADIGSLYVGLCRASGVPAREVFGLRVLPSRLSKSIGKETDVTGGQHCRAEFWSARQGGWVPVDPADVRKVILEENVALKDAHVADLRKKFFGFWEMNWVAFNFAWDFRLPPAPGASVNYLMYPTYLSGSTMKDGMDPKDLGYTITSRMG